MVKAKPTFIYRVFHMNFGKYFVLVTVPKIYKSLLRVASDAKIGLCSFINK